VSPGDAPDIGNQIEMRITTHHRQGVLFREGGDPKIVIGFGAAGSALVSRSIGLNSMGSQTPPRWSSFRSLVK
jgi:hypothetical protein